MPQPDRAAVHKPVLLREVLAALSPRPGEIVLDGTVGAAGHAVEIAAALGPTGRLVGCDRDPMMLRFAEAKLASGELDNATLVHAAYDEVGPHLDAAELGPLDGALVDLGYSSDQLSDDSRGFRFDADGPFDLRFDTSTGRPAAEMLEQADTETLAGWLRDYGEVPAANRVAGAILAARPITSSRQFAEVVAAASPGGRDRHPATQAFQALRIAVNDELGRLGRFLGEVMPARLRPGGRLAVITFHSLEDRLVKSAFRQSGVWTITSPKPITGRPAEVRANPRARSAKLRVATRVGAA